MTESQGFFSWFFYGPQEPEPLPVQPDLGFQDTVFLNMTLGLAVDKVVQMYGSDDGKKAMVSLFIGCFMGTLGFLSFGYAVKTAYRYGKGNLDSLCQVIVLLLQGDEKESESEKRLKELESLVANHVTSLQDLRSEEMQKFAEQYLESYQRTLQTSNARLGTMVNLVQDFMQTVEHPGKPYFGEKENSGKEDTSGDSNIIGLLKPTKTA